MVKHLVHVRVNRALKNNIPDATGRVYQPGKRVLKWRESIVENRIGEWAGLYTVNSFNKYLGIVLAQESEDRSHERYKIAPVKPFLQTEEAGTCFKSNVRSAFSIFCTKNRVFYVQFTKVVRKEDLRASSAETMEMISSEVSNLLR